MENKPYEPNPTYLVQRVHSSWNKKFSLFECSVNKVLARWDSMTEVDMSQVYVHKPDDVYVHHKRYPLE